MLGKGLPASQGEPLSVLTYNMGDIESRSSSTYMEKLVDLVRRHGVPDLLILQEAPGQKAVELLSRQLEMESHVFAPYRKSNGFGLAILARGELGKHKTLYFKASRVGRGALFTEVLIGGKKVVVGSVHMDHIDSVTRSSHGILVSWKGALQLIGKELALDSIRSLCAAELTEWLSAQNYDRIIIGGDFNTIPLSKTYRIMNRQFSDALWPSWDFFRGSYFKTSLPIQPRIDYIFFTEDLTCRDAYILRETIGDHFPVAGRFNL